VCTVDPYGCANVQCSTVEYSTAVVDVLNSEKISVFHSVPACELLYDVVSGVDFCCNIK